jgi:hypothetical protein
LNAKHDNSERGQAIVYLVIGLVVFLGFVALAIDGAMALADRRNLQNVADAASLAGGGKAALDLEKWNIDTGNWSCGNLQFAMNNAEYFAITRAAANNFTITDTVGITHNYVDATCNNARKYIAVTVEISATTPSNFLHLVFPNALHSEMEAVTRIYPGGPLAYGNAIVALNPDTCSGKSVETGAGFSGNTEVNVFGGGIFSNGCLVGSGNADVNVDGGDISYFYPAYKEGVFSPDPVKATEPIPPSKYNITLPDCSAAGANHNVDAKTLEKDLKNRPVTLEAGLWCISGDLTINAKDILHGTGVTIFMVDGWFDVRGTADIQLSAPAEDPDPSPAIPGVLIYLPVNNPGPVILNGNSTSFFQGTILAPGADITMNGTANIDAYHSQVIGYNVKVNGSSLFNITYEPEENGKLPTTIELYR